MEPTDEQTPINNRVEIECARTENPRKIQVIVYTICESLFLLLFGLLLVFITAGMDPFSLGPNSPVVSRVEHSRYLVAALLGFAILVWAIFRLFKLPSALRKIEP